ncbi:hypothetical protein MAR_015758 [Mya arenaria]|uniref:Uncharacterized protein n=1 Tax=Mya arenaria TaxID=6604 RepID=A0ABY7FLQ1_MYAAR|nr:hypothetical protein MAR_015758 [Mya arenaria]
MNHLLLNTSKNALKMQRNYIRCRIVADVAYSPFFSIMADEPLILIQSTCIRYLSLLEVRGDFLGFVPLPRTDAEIITTAMVEHLEQ